MPSGHKAGKPVEHPLRKGSNPFPGATSKEKKKNGRHKMQENSDKMTQEKEKPTEFSHLVRVAGRDISGQKTVIQGLALIRGIGPRTARIVCNIAGVDWRKKIGNLTEKDVEAVEKGINDLEKTPPWLLNRQKDYETGKSRQVIGADLALSLREDINRMKKIRSYKGVRHELGLPVRGQRTRSSFRTGTTVGVSRKKLQQAAAAAKKEEEEKAKEKK